MSILTEEEHKDYLHIDLTHFSVDPSDLIDLQKSIKESKRISFQYISAQNEQTTRETDPHSLHYKFRTWYLYAYCHLREDYREFKVSHMLNLRQLSTPIETKHPLRPDAPLVDPLRASMTLCVHPQSVNLVLNHFRHQSMFQEEDGSFTMELSVPVPLDAEWLISILLGLGTGVVVISPLYLQDVLKNEAKKS